MKTVNLQTVNLQVVNLQSVKNLLDLSAAHCGHLATLHWPARYVALYFQHLTVPGLWLGSGVWPKNGQIADCQLAVGQLDVGQEFVE